MSNWFFFCGHNGNMETNTASQSPGQFLSCCPEWDQENVISHWLIPQKRFKPNIFTSSCCVCFGSLNFVHKNDCLPPKRSKMGALDLCHESGYCILPVLDCFSLEVQNLLCFNGKDNQTGATRDCIFEWGFWQWNANEVLMLVSVWSNAFLKHRRTF